MKSVLAAIIAALLAAFLFATAAGADNFVAGGTSIPSPAPFDVLSDKDEVCAPAAAALRHLGVQITDVDGRIDMRASDGSALLARIGSDRATVAGVERNLPAPLSRRDGQLYLPVRAVAWHLGLAYRWDKDSRTIFLHPKITDITFSRLPDKVRVKITATAPLSYSAGLLKRPARIYVDVANADLFAAEQQIAVNEADLIAVRASQNSLNPDLVRIVLDLKQEPLEYYHSSADGGRSIVVDIPAPKLPPQAAEGAVTVRSIRLERRSDTLCALIVEANGNPVASLATRRDPPQAIIEFSNAQLAAEEVDGAHPQVESATAEQTGENQARIVLNLVRPQPAALARRPNGVCVLIGRVPLSDVTVVIDAGHGGRQPGAIGPSGLEEKTVNLAIALHADKLLREQGARVILTRRDDASLTPVTSREELRSELAMRAGLANASKADVFVSIHCNSSPRNGARRTGSEAYYTTPRSLGLAKVMQQEMLKKLKLKDSGVRTCSFVVTREARMPAVLVEVAYLNDMREEALLGSPEFRQRAAEAIVSGLQRFAEEGGLLEYYAELESAKWGRALVQQPAPTEEGNPASAPAASGRASATAPSAEEPDNPSQPEPSRPRKPSAGAPTGGAE
jgi:N-acetylmuramoyl-L-alanine amidase